MTSKNFLFCAEPKNNQCNVAEGERIQKEFTFKKLDSDHFTAQSVRIKY